MVRMLQAITVLAMISAGVVFVLCAGQLLQCASGSEEIERKLGPPVLERFRQVAGGSEKNVQEPLSALIRQAEAYALLLNPPQPAKSEQAPAPSRSLKQTVAAAIEAKVKPKFTLVGTSYYRSMPEESMALVSEPGSGTGWVKKGARLGHFIVEKVERGTLVYRDGNRLCEVA